MIKLNDEINQLFSKHSELASSSKVAIHFTKAHDFSYTKFKLTLKPGALLSTEHFSFKLASNSILVRQLDQIDSGVAVEIIDFTLSLCYQQQN